MPIDPHIVAEIAQAKQAVQPPPAADASPLLRMLMYGLQVADAANSARAFKHGRIETNPLMAPFSHGGFPTMLGGFALGDLIRGALLRHASPGTRNTADALQGLSNLGGILQTNRAMHQHLVPTLVGKAPAPPPTPGPPPGYPVFP